VHKRGVRLRKRRVRGKERGIEKEIQRAPSAGEKKMNKIGYFIERYRRWQGKERTG